MMGAVVVEGAEKTQDKQEEVKVEAAPAALESADDGCTCPGKLGRLVPPEYLEELKQLLHLAGPVIISQMMTFMISFVSTVFCGHLGKTELAGVSLAISVINVTGVSIGTGLSLTCDTLISQTYGSGNLKRVGVILQRGVLILLLACFPCWAILINTEPLLLAVRQSPEVASLTQLYVKIFMPALPASFMYQLQARYLQNQGIIWPQVITGAIANICNAIINYVLLYVLDLGVAGSAAANAISMYFLAVIMYVYICARGLHKATWGGWTVECLQEWGPFIHLAIPSMLMLCLEWWLFEVGGFLAGVISEAELGSQSIIYELTVVAYMFPLGLSAAASVRVGNALGAGDTKKAKLSCKVNVICGFIVACLMSTLIGVLRHVIGYIFTSEEEILLRVGEVLLVFCFTHLFDALAGVTGGVLRGAGKQLVGALCNLVGHYFIGFPIGVSLMFAAKMGIMGLWTGLTICVLMQSIFFLVYLGKLDWEKAADDAMVRAGVKTKEETKMARMKSRDSKQRASQAAAPPPLDEGGNVSEEPDADQESNLSEIKNNKPPPAGKVLTLRQLLLRRGLALLVMVLILAVGIVVSEILPPAESDALLNLLEV